jgi:hypothetical protein
MVKEPLTSSNSFCGTSLLLVVPSRLNEHCGAAPSASADPFQALDDSKITRFQIKTMFVSGMGFFTDAYDLFVIGIVVSILKIQWSLDTTQVLGSIPPRCLPPLLAPSFSAGSPTCRAGNGFTVTKSLSSPSAPSRQPSHQASYSCLFAGSSWGSASVATTPCPPR